MKSGRSILLLLALASGWGNSSLPADELGAQERIPAALLRDNTDSASEFMISTWKTGNGLPGNEIQDLKETPDGYLWLGTHQGLVRFDGVRFHTFFGTPTGLRYGTRVEPLAIDARGRLWFTPDQVGLYYRAGGDFTEILTNETILPVRVESLCSDGTNGMMWVDANGGLGRASIDHPGRGEKVNGSGTSGASKWIRDFSGELWLVGPRNFKIYTKGNWRDIAVPGTATFVAAPRRAGGLWVAREARLRYVTADGATREVATVPWRGQSRVQCMMEDSSNRLWIGTVGQGLFCYSNGEFKHVVPTASSINCLLEDSEENIWVGTRGGGLIRVRQRQFFMHDLGTGLQNEFVRSLSQDQTGRVWVVTAEGGLGWWQEGAWHQLGEADGWPGYDSLSVLPSQDGGVWISTARRGIWRWSNGKFARQSTGTKSPKEPATDLLEDRQGRLWMVTDNSGIYCLEGNTLTGYSTEEGLPSNLMRRMVEDETGEIWAGDWEGGIARFRGQRWELVRKSSGHADAVRSMVAADGALWIGTSAGGLLRLKNGQSARVSVTQGLPDASIRQLLSDGQGGLWGGTPHKLFRVSLARLNAVMEGHEQELDTISYGRSDGLPDLSFSSWCDPRCWRTTAGELWFATANGAVYFQPSRLRASKPPRPVLEQTLLDGKSTALRHLRPSVGRLEFRFSAPCLTAPERVRFRYQLTGVDSDWVDAETTRTATYASIPAGDHVFRVVASSPEGVWGSEAASIAFSVSPYFWQTHWFLAAVTAAFAGGSVWIIRRATVHRLRRRLEESRRQHAVDRERARIAQDIHDELGANLTRIGLLADMGARHKLDPPAVARDLDQISETARESVAAMDAIVWALNPRNDSLDNFANYVAQFTRDFFAPTQLRIRLDLPTNLPVQPLAAETRHQLFLLLKESFNNIVRHARASEVHVALACEADQLRLTIADDGQGLADHPAGAGRDGLINLQERIERLGGSLRIESKTSQGVKLEFILPVAKLRFN
jgi:signal transduction histidine kinase/ligand-binding sensor domain-containing protein